MSNHNQRPRPLARALLSNAAFSTVCGISLIAGAHWLEPLLGVPATALRVVGATLLPFAYGLARNARRTIIDRREATLAVALDLGWVVGSAALVLGELWPLTTAGVWAVAGVADVVLVFALWQAFALRQSRATKLA